MHLNTLNIINIKCHDMHNYVINCGIYHDGYSYTGVATDNKIAL